MTVLLSTVCKSMQADLFMREGTIVPHEIQGGRSHCDDQCVRPVHELGPVKDRLKKKETLRERTRADRWHNLKLIDEDSVAGNRRLAGIAPDTPADGLHLGRMSQPGCY